MAGGLDATVPSGTGCGAPAPRGLGHAVVAAVLVVLAGALGLTIWLVTYTPLANGSFGSGPESSTTVDWSSGLRRAVSGWR